MLKRLLTPFVLLAALFALSACYVAPAPPDYYAYGPYYGPGYYYGPPVGVDVGVGYWHGHRWH
ncbi:MAG TPA: hypothetical protein VLV50_09165 [Stellaceae bacterium]|nr:hypothetical protein [Stellaceae bacterium]